MCVLDAKSKDEFYDNIVSHALRKKRDRFCSGTCKNKITMTMTMANDDDDDGITLNYTMIVTTRQGITHA